MEINAVELSENVTKTTKEPENSPMKFEDALTLTGFGKFNYFLIFVCGLILSAVLLETLGISFVLPIAQCDLTLTIEQKGILSSMMLAGIISSSHLWGFLADTIGRRKIILPTLFISFGFTFFGSLADNFWIFVICRFFTGFFVSASSATVYAYLSEFHNNKNRSRAIMGASVIFGCGCMLLPALAWAIINQDWILYIPVIGIYYKPWRLFLVVCGLPSFVSAVGLIFIPESPKFLLLKGNQEKTIETIKKIQAYNSAKEIDIKMTSIVDESMTSTTTRNTEELNLKSVSSVFKSMWQQTAPLFNKELLKKTTLACTLQFWIFVSSNGMYIWFPDILNRIAEYIEIHPRGDLTICEILAVTKLNLSSVTNATEIALECTQKLDISAYQHTLTVEALYAIGFAVIGVIINTLGKLPILLFVFIGCGLCAIGIVYITIPLLSIYLYIIVLACGLAISLVNAATVDLYPTNLRAMAVCISLMMGRLGSIFGSNIIGILLEFKCYSAFWFSGLSLIGCGIVSCFIPGICTRVNNTKIDPEENAP